MVESGDDDAAIAPQGARLVPLSGTEHQPAVGAAFAALLARLASEGRPPEQTYERLRKRLIVFFRLHVPPEAEALADVALDRLARKLHEGTVVESVYAFALGIARMLVREAQARLTRESRASHGSASSFESPPTPAESLEVDVEAATLERRVAALRVCLERLGSAASRIILTYYSADGAQRIAVRQRLAADLALSLNALRNRALRLRGMLERCLLERGATVAPAPGFGRDETAGDDT